MHRASKLAEAARKIKLPDVGGLNESKGVSSGFRQLIRRVVSQGISLGTEVKQLGYFHQPQFPPGP